jgi:hypothetical protein
MITPYNTCVLIGHDWTFKGEKKICQRCGLAVSDDLDERVNNLTEDTAANLQIANYLLQKQVKTMSDILKTCIKYSDE